MSVIYEMYAFLVGYVKLKRILHQSEGYKQRNAGLMSCKQLYWRDKYIAHVGFNVKTLLITCILNVWKSVACKCVPSTQPFNTSVVSGNNILVWQNVWTISVIFRIQYIPSSDIVLILGNVWVRQFLNVKLETNCSNKIDMWIFMQ